jgi:hypothetical protein
MRKAAPAAAAGRRETYVMIAQSTVMTIKTWLDIAIQDAERRGLPSLRPLLEALARSTSALRTADWNWDATGEFDGPAGRHDR